MKNREIESNKIKENYYIVADHLRTVVFALCDGAFFDSKGRGYILKKLLKKVCLSSYYLKIEEEGLKKIVEEIIEVNCSFYRKLIGRKEYLLKEIERQIGNNFKSISNSLSKLDKFYNSSIGSGDIFFWYDTLGIPYQIIESYLQEKKHLFSQEEFTRLLNEQKERSAKARQNKRISVFK
jgi:alanyl-tRNA synthetase